MIVNQQNLRTLLTAFKGNFQSGLGMAASQYLQIATEVPSTTSAEEYGWLGQMPNMREWIGERVVHGIAQHGYTIKNKPFELTIAVPRTSIEDDQYGVYAPLFTEMGRSAAAHPDQLIFGLLKTGTIERCYDSKPFFSADHPVLNEKGKTVTQSNLDDTLVDPGARWYVLDNSRALKPLIFQNRKAPNFVAKDKESDDNVFDQAEFKYGTDRRGAAGFGFWQLAQSSNKALTEDNLWTAIETLTSRTGDNGRPLGLMAQTLVVPPQLKKAATKLLNNELLAGGESNALKGELKLLVCPWLA